MKRTWQAVLLPLFLFSGCASLTDADAGDLDFSWELGNGVGSAEDSEPDVSVGDGELTLSGALAAPDPCRSLEGRLNRSGSRLTLRIEIGSGLSAGEACVTSIGGYRYTAMVRGLEPSTYQLRVILEYPGTGWPTRTVLDRVVSVR